MELAVELETEIWVVTSSCCQRAASLLGARGKGDGSEPKQNIPGRGVGGDGDGDGDGDNEWFR
eukprot:11265652-Karenia_brevis.AAC.1